MLASYRRAGPASTELKMTRVEHGVDGNVGHFAFIVMVAFGYAVAETVTNALGMRVQYQSFSMYSQAGARKKAL